MATASFRTCGSCGTRNKPQWEFCVRCGETLESEAADVQLEPAAENEVVTDLTGFPWRPVLAIAGLALVVAAAAYVRMAPGEKPATSLLAFVAPSPPAPAAPPFRQASLADERLDEGRQLLVSGKPGDALGPLSQAAEAEPQNAHMQATYARALWGSGSREDAIGRYAEAARLDPGQYRNEYATALIDVGRSAEARQVLEEAPNDPKALRALGQLHNAENRPGEALAVLTRAAAMSPEDGRVLANLGFALERTGNADEAVRVLSTVMSRRPDSTTARGLLAEAIFKQGKRDEAVALVRDGLQQQPESPNLHRSLGSLLERAGKAAEAAAAYREYLRLAPDATDASMMADRAARLERVVAANNTSS